MYLFSESRLGCEQQPIPIALLYLFDVEQLNNNFSITRGGRRLNLLEIMKNPPASMFILHWGGSGGQDLPKAFIFFNPKNQQQRSTTYAG